METIIEQSYLARRDFDDPDYKKARGRVVKSAVKTILDIAASKLKKDASKLMVLDVGSGRGEYSIEIARHVKKVVGVEPYKPAHLESIKKLNKDSSNIKFHNALIENFKTREKFDLVISLTTIEHMQQAEKSFKTILKLMKENSLVYLTAPNKLWPYEHHYKLPFLSWLPIALANKYVQITGRGDSYEDSAHSRTYWGMKKLFDKLNCSYEFIIPSEESEYIGCGEGGVGYQLIKSVGIKLIKLLPTFWIFSKGFIIVIQKDDKKS